MRACGVSRAVRGLCPRVMGAQTTHSLTSGLLGRLPRRAGAEERGAHGDEEAAGEEEHE